MRRLFSGKVRPSCGQARTIVQLTSSNPILVANVAKTGHLGTVWVEASDKYWFEKVTKLKEEERPTVIERPSRIELFNLDQITDDKRPAAWSAHGIVGEHSAKLSSNGQPKRYSGAFAKSLQDFRAKHKFDSTAWVSAIEVRKTGLRIDPVKNAPFQKIITGTGEFYNASQFQNPELIQMQAYSGATGRAYGETLGQVLTAHAKSNGFRTAIYFTETQLKFFDADIIVGSNGCAVESDINAKSQLLLYPTTAIVNEDDFLKKLMRFPNDVPAHVISGKPLEGSYLVNAKRSTVPNKYNFWVSAREVESRGFVLKQDAKDMAISSFDAKAPSGTARMVYNIEQVRPKTDKFTMADLERKIGYYLSQE